MALAWCVALALHRGEPCGAGTRGCCRLLLWLLPCPSAQSLLLPPCSLLPLAVLGRPPARAHAAPGAARQRAHAQRGRLWPHQRAGHAWWPAGRGRPCAAAAGAQRGGGHASRVHLRPLSLPNASHPLCEVRVSRCCRLLRLSRAGAGRRGSCVKRWAGTAVPTALPPPFLSCFDCLPHPFAPRLPSPHTSTGPSARTRCSR